MAVSTDISAVHIRPAPGVMGASDERDAILINAPYLQRLALKHEAALARCLSDGPEAALDAATALIDEAMRSCDRAEVCRLLRVAKAEGHLAIALADLSGAWDVETVTRAITKLAEGACQAALWQAYRNASERDWVAPRETPEDTGLFAVAMGKMGACELNYSSDADLVILFDPTRFEARSRSAKEAAVKITQDFVNIMETRDADGYVFRIDLRLRPDPSANAVAISTETALNYYESLGQNWERMAYIKARICAGDTAAGEAFLKELEPYVWRRHLDYWALSDIHSIKRQIHAHGGHMALDEGEFDVKLGRGGIREIEFYAQTQQLILGGRDPSLRHRRTDEALDALVATEAVAAETRDRLMRCYDFLRALEHRIQMQNDEQTHMLSGDEARRRAVARLAGYGDDLAVFNADVASVRRYVHGIYSDLFAQEERLSGETGNLVFTGVDDDPGTLRTLAEMGFSNPSRVIETVRRWHRGGLPATRSARGRELLTRLTPRLLTWMSEAGETDAALARFADFLAGLRGGVQVFALMMAEPAFARDLIATMAYAPKLATDLARQPALLDGMLDNSFHHPLSEDTRNRIDAALQAELGRAETFEDRLNAARRIHREEALRIGYQVLRGRAKAMEAGKSYTRLADACIASMADAALREVVRKFGDWPVPWAICGLGKLGGREMSATSDLDIMIVYDPGEPPSLDDLAPRFAQRLIAALSAPTEEGLLYEVDMQLRPSGGAGPVAVKLSAFEKYYVTDAWTWEFMALTRLRVVAGDPDLAARIMEVKRNALAARASHPDITADILDMRRRLAAQKPWASEWDVKLAPGGLLDAEFVVQQAMLLNAASAPQAVQANMADAIDALAEIGGLTHEDAAILRNGYGFLSDLQQALRIAVGDVFDPAVSSNGLKAWLAEVAGCEDFRDLQERLRAVQSSIAALRMKKIGSLATETPDAAVTSAGLGGNKETKA